MIPSRAECLRLLEEKGVPEHIRQHIFQVTKIAMFLGHRISRKEKINLSLLEAASLLHDLDRHLTFEEVQNHGQKTAEMLKEIGYDELIPLIIRHRMTAINTYGLSTWEEKILYYADIRVKHDKIVPLSDRIAYIMERYGSRSAEAAKNILATIPPLKRLEKEILAKAGVSDKLEGI
jgi:putative nucleotidyltransferase with HDIG domain